jgi:CBS domain-containing protein
MTTPTVSAFMSSPVIAVGIDDPLTAANDLMQKHSVSCLVVSGRAGPAGVVTRTDLLLTAGMHRRVFGGPSTLELPSGRVGDVMTAPLISVPLDASLAEACSLMVDRHIHRVFVRDGSWLVGVFSTKEAMRAVLQARLATPISEWMSTPVLSVEATDTLAVAMDRLAEAAVAGLVVMDSGRAIGMFTQEEALESRRQRGILPVEEAMTQSLVCLPPDTPLFRAAGFTIATRARRVLAVEHHQVRGILTGLDFARALLPAHPREHQRRGCIEDSTHHFTPERARASDPRSCSRYRGAGGARGHGTCAARRNRAARGVAIAQSRSPEPRCSQSVMARTATATVAIE